MKALKAFAGLAACLGCLLLGSRVSQAEDICGTICATRIITEDSRLISDVTCTVVDAPCIRLEAPGIKLELNGHSITGRAEPPDNCTNPADFVPEDGIVGGAGQNGVAVLGPGLVQKFRRHGIFLSGSTQVRVKHVTSSHNCFSGILLGGVTDSDVEENVSVRNAIAAGGNACGGT